ncbi:hypothetical protein DL96DRAFT_1559781 [Flagelloscypha sp. PMI_526]|nr:hypothetical protein DL96DRAFT_1559781 [Flagelloscypha sp. PMI_526]
MSSQASLDLPHLQPSAPSPWRVQESERLQDLRAIFEERYIVDNLHRTARKFNAPTMDRLAHCILTDNCGPGEERVIILASYHFGDVWYGRTRGEDIWAASTIEAFTSLNYTLFYTFGSMDTLLIYQNIPPRLKPNVRILWEDSTFKNCVLRNDTNYLEHEEFFAGGEWQLGKQACIKRHGFEDGIPVWNSFIFHFWDNPLSPLGSQWTLSPEDYAAQNEHGMGNQYLGYSIESFCRKRTFIPRSQREHRALVLGKDMSYFNPQSNDRYPWKNPEHPDQDLLNSVVPSIPPSSSGQPFTLVGTAQGAEVIHNLGVLEQAEFYKELGKSKALLGVGNPSNSPSPYDGLCLGVPFINPIHTWDHDDPTNKFKWWTQHDPLKALDPPYVYNVRDGDAEGLEAAFKSAMEHPIDRFIPPAMSTEAVKERHRVLVETDWHTRAKEHIQKEFLDRGKLFEYLL